MTVRSDVMELKLFKAAGKLPKIIPHIKFPYTESDHQFIKTGAVNTDWRCFPKVSGCRLSRHLL